MLCLIIKMPNIRLNKSPKMKCYAHIHGFRFPNYIKNMLMIYTTVNEKQDLLGIS